MTLFEIKTEKKRGNSPTDDLDVILRELEKEELRRLRGLKLQEYRLEAEKRVRELENEIKKIGQGNIKTDLDMAIALARLPDEERKKVIEVIKALDSMGKGDIAPQIMPYLITEAMKKNQTSTAKELSEYIDVITKASELKKEDRTPELVNAMANMMRVFIESNNANNNKEDRTVELLNAMANMMKVFIESNKANNNNSKDILEAVKLGLELGKNMNSMNETERKVLSSLIELAIKTITTPSKGFWDTIMEDPDKLAKLRELIGGYSIEHLKLLKDMSDTDKMFNLMLKKLEHERELREAEIRERLKRESEFRENLQKMISSLRTALTETNQEGQIQEVSMNQAAMQNNIPLEISEERQEVGQQPRPTS